MNKFLIAFLFSSFMVFAQQTDVVDFLNISGVITPNFQEKKIEGGLFVEFKILKSNTTEYN